MLVAVPTVILLNGCHLRTATLFGGRTPAEMKGFIQQTDRLYHAYLDGDRDQARHSLQETIKLIERAKLPPNGQAHTLFVTYCRLCVLEKKAGNEALAEDYLLKTRDRYLRELEIDGQSADPASQAVKSFTGDKAQEVVEKLDKSNKG